MEKIISFAPMEGITGPTYRRIHREIFGGVDRYYTPFLAANKNHHFKQRETREYLPYDDMLIPQVMTSSAEDFIWAARTIADAGYSEVNINLGCPASTIVTKKKGAGMLEDLRRLRQYLDDIFACKDLPQISVKTRIGFEDPADAEDLGELYAQYPFCEVIIHPRVRQDFYGNTPNLEAFRIMKEKLSCPVCYNGDIKIPEDAFKIAEMFPDMHHIMIGRGLVANPALAVDIRKAERGENSTGPSKEEMQRFIDALWIGYKEIYSGEKDVFFKMKELWSHMGVLYPDKKKQLDKIKKCKNVSEYQELVREIME